MTREEAIRELREDKALYETDNCHAGDGSPDGDLLEALDMAIEALSADAVHGEWIPFDLTWGRNVYFCTACKESTEVPTVNGQPSYNFCPNCGARMTPYKGGDAE